jgi:hypothetical protein
MVAAVVAVLLCAQRGRWNVGAMFVATVNLLIAGLNSVAPFRGPLDPGYIGYTFGWFSAGRGLAVTAVAGSILLATGVAACLAARNRRGPGMAWVAAVDAVLCASLVGALLAERLNLENFKLQFGEYLTIPGLVGLATIVSLIVLPLGASTLWAFRRRTRAHSQSSLSPRIHRAPLR